MDGQRISFTRPLPDVADLSDENFLSAIAWSQQAPESLRESARAGDPAGFGVAWSRDFRERTRWSGKHGDNAAASPLWSRHALEASPRTAGLVRLLDEVAAAERKKKSGKKIAVGPPQPSRKSKPSTNGHASKHATRVSRLISEWLEDAASPNRPAETVATDELLLLLHVLSHPKLDLHAEIFCPLWRTALAAAVACLGKTPQTADEELPDRRLLLEGELPWHAGLFFDGVQGAERLRRRGSKALRKQLLDLTDTDGTPHATLLERLPLWMASLVRATETARLYDVDLWDEEADERFESLVEIAAPFCRADGQMAMSNGSSHQPAALLETASRLAGFQKRSLPRSYLRSLNGRNGKSAPVPRIRDEDDFPVTQSDWAQVACLRSDWSPHAGTLVVAHDREKPLVDLTLRSRSVLKGLWDLQLTVGGKRLDLDDWSCSCWSSDEDADFLELHADLDGQVQVDRQILLSRTDEFLVLADAVSGAGDRRIDYTTTLPMVDGVEAEADVETRECRLKRPGLVARVFPLALPDERILSTPGRFGPEEGQLVLNQASAGQGLYAPLLIDWAPQRRRSEAEWKTLTVTEGHQVLKPGTAAGHRFRIGERQLLVYRSLKKTPNARAVLGQHTREETLIGEFEPAGTVTPIMLVE